MPFLSRERAAWPDGSRSRLCGSLHTAMLVCVMPRTARENDSRAVRGNADCLTIHPTPENRADAHNGPITRFRYADYLCCVGSSPPSSEVTPPVVEPVLPAELVVEASVPVN